MADSSVLARALAKRKQLALEIERLDAFIETYRELDDSGSTEPAHEVESRTTSSRGGRRKSLPDVAFTIRASCSAPLPVGELASFLKERGRPVGGKNLNVNLSSILSRDPRFETVPGRGWKLKSETPNNVETDDAPPATTDEASNSEGLAGSPGGALQP